MITTLCACDMLSVIVYYSPANNPELIPTSSRTQPDPASNIFSMNVVGLRIFSSGLSTDTISGSITYLVYGMEIVCTCTIVVVSG